MYFYFSEGQSIPKDSLAINKFVVNVPDSVLQDLKTRLNNAKFVESIEGSNFRYGFNSNYLKQVVEFWKTKFDWRQQEKELNKYNHFKTQIEGIDVHFVHVKPSKPAKTVVPLLLLHGWPGSFYEFYKSIPLLTEPVNDLAFEIVCPSIPGYGFSEAPHQEGMKFLIEIFNIYFYYLGFNILHAARFFVKLMNRLGHKKFFVQGGDWGGIIGTVMSNLYPEK